MCRVDGHCVCFTPKACHHYMMIFSARVTGVVFTPSRRGERQLFSLYVVIDHYLVSDIWWWLVQLWNANPILLAGITIYSNICRCMSDMQQPFLLTQLSHAATLPRSPWILVKRQSSSMALPPPSLDRPRGIPVAPRLQMVSPSHVAQPKPTFS